MRVRDLMTRDVVTLNAQADLELAEDLMTALRIRHLPVVSGSRLVGLVTHRDLLRASLSTLAGHDAVSETKMKLAVPVSHIMRHNVATCGPEDDLREIIATMRRHRYGCMPVVDPEGDLVGIVTEADFLELTQVLLDRVEDLEMETLRTLAGQLKAENTQSGAEGGE